MEASQPASELVNRDRETIIFLVLTHLLLVLGYQNPYFS